RMKDLVEATGAPKSTILFYVEQGLLPRPRKTSPNMAYYDPACVERITLIRSWQQSFHLPLEKIRRLLERRDRGQDIGPLLDLTRAVFGEEGGPLLDLAAFCRATGLSPDQVAALRKESLLLPLTEKGFDARDAALGRIYARGLAAGMRPEDWSYYPRLGREIVDHEMRLRDRMTGRLPLEEDAALTIFMVQAARATRSYVIDRLFQLRVAAARDLKDSGASPPHPHRGSKRPPGPP
ncbi:MAG: MerR family transcriptional regulator, partial [Thermodesulfobacteriota bacterium]